MDVKSKLPITLLFTLQDGATFNYIQVAPSRNANKSVIGNLLFKRSPLTHAFFVASKEKAVVEFIQEVFSDFTWNVDKRVADGCSRRRPDLLLDMGSQIIIVEIDENSHSTYDCS